MKPDIGFISLNHFSACIVVPLINTFKQVGTKYVFNFLKKQYRGIKYKGCFTYTPNPNRNRTETVTATALHRFVFGRPFTYEPNPWTKCKKMPVYFGLISLSDSRNTFTIQIVSCHCIKFVVFIVALGIVPQTSVVNSIVLVK